MMSNTQGWLNIYKPRGISSFSAVYKIKKKFNLKKIGHGGTLDPLAEGVLPIAIGKTTKLIPFINKDIKEYEFKIKWGEQTSTDDSEGEVIARSSKILKVLNKAILYNNNKKQIIYGANRFLNKEYLPRGYDNSWTINQIDEMGSLIIFKNNHQKTIKLDL